MLKRAWLLTIGITVISAMLFAVSIIYYVQTVQRNDIVYSLTDVKPAENLMILGASVKPDGSPTPALEDRLSAAADVFKTENIKHVLTTGDDGAFKTPEVATMRRMALEQGIGDGALIVDPHGYRTYESCKHAAELFKQEKIIIVTQAFHLPRALYICESFGLNAQGYAAPENYYHQTWFDKIRDLLASFKAWWDLNIVTPRPPVNYES